jgi:glutamate-1-semialdehyde aminotransferase
LSRGGAAARVRDDPPGCRITDVDGSTCLDDGLAWGPLILGHRHPRLVKAVRAQADRPHTLGAQHELEPRVAEQICRIVPGALALSRGLCMLADGRFHVSTVHREDDIRETLDIVDAVLGRMKEEAPAPRLGDQPSLRGHSADPG